MPTFLFPIATFMLVFLLLLSGIGFYQSKSSKIFIKSERLSDWIAIFAISSVVSVTMIGFFILIGA